MSVSGAVATAPSQKVVRGLFCAGLVWGMSGGQQCDERGLGEVCVGPQGSRVDTHVRAPQWGRSGCSPEIGPQSQHRSRKPGRLQPALQELLAGLPTCMMRTCMRG